MQFPCKGLCARSLVRYCVYAVVPLFSAKWFAANLWLPIYIMLCGWFGPKPAIVQSYIDGNILLVWVLLLVFECFQYELLPFAIWRELSKWLLIFNEFGWQIGSHYWKTHFLLELQNSKAWGGLNWKPLVSSPFCFVKVCCEHQVGKKFQGTKTRLGTFFGPGWNANAFFFTWKNLPLPDPKCFPPPVRSTNILLISALSAFNWSKVLPGLFFLFASFTGK